MNSALNSASTSSIFSTSMARGNPFRVPGDMSMLCVSSFIDTHVRRTAAPSESSPAFLLRVLCACAVAVERLAAFLLGIPTGKYRPQK